MERNQAGSDNQLTRIFHGVDATTSIHLETIGGAKSRLDICDDAFGTLALVQFEEIKNAIKDASQTRLVKIRFITEIKPENLQSCKELMAYVDLRHLDGVKGNFAVSEKRYYAFAPLKEARVPTEAIQSSVKTVVEQNQYLFDVLWNKSESGIQRIRQIEEGIPPIETRVVSGHENITLLIFSFLQKAASPKKDPLDSFIFAATDRKIPVNHQSNLDTARRMRKQNLSLRILIVTDIQKENLEYIKKQIDLGIDIRHIDRNRISFAVSKDGYITSGTDVIGGSDLPAELIWSNNPDVISQAVQMFEMLWETGIPAEQRIHQIEHGIEELGETKIVKTLEESTVLGKELMDGTRNEVLIILASERTITRNSKMYEELIRESNEKKINIRILAPVALNEDSNQIFRGASWRRIPPMNVGFAIYDRCKMLITQYVNPEALDSNDAFITNIFTTNKQTIDGIASIFEALWNVTELKEREMEARERESRSRRQAQLLQDILTHDIRNYNQVSRLTAELIKEESAGNKDLQDLADSLLASIDGSTSLVDRAKSLGRIVSEERPRLHSVNLRATIEASLELVKRAYPDKEIDVEVKFDLERTRDNQEIRVLADDLLNEVFSNVFSNATKYTSRKTVKIDINISEEKEKGETFFKISISDYGRGIPEEIRENLFNRYLIGAKGSGLGLSIVHALVSDRYKGKVKVSDRRVGPGTTVEVYLPVYSSS
ncbi:MAG: sensor histidine kinase [Nitrososphaerales archaeon]